MNSRLGFALIDKTLRPVRAVWEIFLLKFQSVNTVRTKSTSNKMAQDDCELTGTVTNTIVFFPNRKKVNEMLMDKKYPFFWINTLNILNMFVLMRAHFLRCVEWYSLFNHRSIVRGSSSNYHATCSRSFNFIGIILNTVVINNLQINRTVENQL